MELYFIELSIGNNNDNNNNNSNGKRHYDTYNEDNFDAGVYSQVENQM